MKLFYIISCVLIIMGFGKKLTSFLKFKFQLKKGNFDLIRLKGYSNNSWFFFISGIVSIGVGFTFYYTQNNDYALVVWLILGLLSIIHCFIAPHDYLLINNNGISNSYDGKKIEWEKINGIDFKSYGNQDFFTIKTGKKSITVFYGGKEYLDKIIDLIKEKRIDIYQKYFHGIM